MSEWKNKMIGGPRYSSDLLIYNLWVIYKSLAELMREEGSEPVAQVSKWFSEL